MPASKHSFWLYLGSLSVFLWGRLQRYLCLPVNTHSDCIWKIFCFPVRKVAKVSMPTRRHSFWLYLEDFLFSCEEGCKGTYAYQETHILTVSGSFSVFLWGRLQRHLCLPGNTHSWLYLEAFCFPVRKVAKVPMPTRRHSFLTVSRSFLFSCEEGCKGTYAYQETLILDCIWKLSVFLWGRLQRYLCLPGNTLNSFTSVRGGTPGCISLLYVL